MFFGFPNGIFRVENVRKVHNLAVLWNLHLSAVRGRERRASTDSASRFAICRQRLYWRRNYLDVRLPDEGGTSMAQSLQDCCGGSPLLTRIPEELSANPVCTRTFGRSLARLLLMLALALGL